MTLQTLKIGTRGSPLALKQTEMVITALQQAWPDLACEVVEIRTSGDWKKEDGETPLPELEGGKAQFAKEIEQALLAGAIDCGVHSAKDMAAILPDGLVMAHYLPRADARDAFLCDGCTGFEDLKKGGVVGTCSPRRTAILLNKRPDLKIVPMRGNVHTRIQKLCAGNVDLTILAMAGLERLGLHGAVEHGSVVPIEPEDMLPACGQGAVGIEIHKDRADVRELFDAVNDQDTALCVSAEREVVRTLNGSCHTPIAAYAVLEEGTLYLRALVASLDGSKLFYEEWKGAVSNLEEAVSKAAEVGYRLKEQAPEDLFE